MPSLELGKARRVPAKDSKFGRREVELIVTSAAEHGLDRASSGQKRRVRILEGSSYRAILLEL